MNFTSLTFWNLRFPINRIATILCIVKCFYKDSLYRKKCMMLSKCLRNRDLFPLTLIYLLFILSFPLPVSVSFSLIVLVSLLHLISIILLPTTFKSIYLAKFAKQNDTGRLSICDNIIYCKRPVTSQQFSNSWFCSVLCPDKRRIKFKLWLILVVAILIVMVMITVACGGFLIILFCL